MQDGFVCHDVVTKRLWNLVIVLLLVLVEQFNDEWRVVGDAPVREEEILDSASQVPHML
jgi:hypothetical protein